MFLYNTTFSIENDSIQQWESWMKRNYFPSLADLLPNASCNVWEIMSGEDKQSTNFSCQWICETPEELQVINKYSAALLSNISGEMGEKCLHFSTILRKSGLF